MRKLPALQWQHHQSQERGHLRSQREQGKPEVTHQPYQAMISIKNSTGSYQIDSAQIVTGTLADYDQINDIVGMISEDEQEYLRIMGKIVMELNDPYTFGDVYLTRNRSSPRFTWGA
jgi:hypothetical protein